MFTCVRERSRQRCCTVDCADVLCSILTVGLLQAPRFPWSSHHRLTHFSFPSFLPSFSCHVSLPKNSQPSFRLRLCTKYVVYQAPSANTSAYLVFISLSCHLTTLCVFIMCLNGSTCAEVTFIQHTCLRCLLLHVWCSGLLEVNATSHFILLPVSCTHACTHVHKHTKRTLEQIIVFSTQSFCKVMIFMTIVRYLWCTFQPICTVPH